VTILKRKKLTPEEKVNLAIKMTDMYIQRCADAIKAQNPGITEKQLKEKLRAKLMRQKRRHHEV